MTVIGSVRAFGAPQIVRSSRRVAIAGLLACGVALLLAPVVVQVVLGRSMRTRFEAYEVARQSLRAVMGTTRVLHDLSLNAAAGVVPLDGAVAGVQAASQRAIQQFAVATAAPELRAAASRFEATVRAQTGAMAEAARAGGEPNAVAAVRMDAINSDALDVTRAIDAAQDARVDNDYRARVIAALVQAVASVGLLTFVAREVTRRHRVHESRNQRLARMLESVTDAVIVRDGQGRITEWNDRATALYGYTREEALGHSDLPEAVAQELTFAEVMAALTAGGEVVARRVARRHKDGSIVHADVSAFALLDDQGRPSGTCALYVDVTAEVQAAAALRRSEAYLRSLLDSSTIGLGAAVIDASGTIAFANAAFERLAPAWLGLTREPLIGSTIESAAGRDDHEGGEDAPPNWLQTVRSGLAGTASSVEFRVERGRWVRVDAAPVWDEAGGSPGMTLIVRDITTTRVDRERARDAEGRAAAIFHAAPVGLLVMDERGRIEEVNAAACEITGYPAAALLGRTVTMLADLSEAMHQQFVEQTLAAITPDQTARGVTVPHPDRLEIRRMDGRTFPASVQVGVLNMGAPTAGGSIRFLCAVTDMSAQVAAEREARRVERTQALSTLVAGVAHDFNNLLTVISGGIELARTGMGDTTEWLDRSAAASAQAAGLVRQLLRYSRPETDALDSVRLDEVVRETISLVHATFDRRVLIQHDIAPGEANVYASRSQIEQVVMNLLVNARDAVLARLDEEAVGSGAFAGAYAPTISVSLRTDTDDPTRTVLRVRDNGVGIPQEVIEHVFDPFFTTKGPDRGTGLGLAIVYSTVHAHGGTVTVDSVFGGGAEFCVSLPLEAPRAGLPAGAPDAPARSVRGRALVIDDEEAVARIAQRVLTTAGMDVTVTLTGLDAVRLCREQLFDVILLDLSMPRPDGTETLTRLRAVAPRTPVIIVSGRMGAGDVAAAESVAFLAKPYLAPDLLASVSAAIEGHTVA